MPKVNMIEMLQKAKREGYAVPLINIDNLEWLHAVMDTAQRLQSPIIIGTAPFQVEELGGMHTVVGMIDGLAKDKGYTIPYVIHLDHGDSYERCVAAIDAGFSSVMIDASSLPLEENIAVTKKVVAYAHAHNISVEAEIGHVGGDEFNGGKEVLYADFDECVRMVKETGVDCLTPALGSVHGDYKGEPKLGFDEMKAISEAVQIPLVLHGGSGIPDEQIRKCIERGTAKINVATENRRAYHIRLRELLAADPNCIDPMKTTWSARRAIEQIVESKILLFGSKNKA
ncbi:MAG: class II fructose-1,6-bisphosphate aldolase [Erysipelotrichaceae bacterium]|nr:class II fructose-1,6-bisphosphate aldolase [Erysipelotrichaceae bacterium]